ncbi:hypothetical protein O6P43_024026 [Quillaja saponaria]|uniref:Uncharacterized protein n=1 Tax=Quillaja saponaria TaxID=32244 RepID=A0AAD7L5U9_QUISA|nr:hypothetical protein O6P43_024026 [Quillaja saponaria]
MLLKWLHLNILGINGAVRDETMRHYYNLYNSNKCLYRGAMIVFVHLMVVSTPSRLQRSICRQKGHPSRRTCYVLLLLLAIRIKKKKSCSVTVTATAVAAAPVTIPAFATHAILLILAFRLLPQFHPRFTLANLAMRFIMARVVAVAMSLGVTRCLVGLTVCVTHRVVAMGLACAGSLGFGHDVVRRVGLVLATALGFVNSVISLVAIVLALLISFEHITSHLRYLVAEGIVVAFCLAGLIGWFAALH